MLVIIQRSLRALLFPPHRDQALHALIVRLVDFHGVQRLSQNLLCASILAISQELFNRLDEALVEAARERGTRVVREDAHEHDGIVLDGGFRGIVATEVAFDLLGGGLGGGGRGFGGFDDDGEVEDFLVAIAVVGRLAEEADAARCVCFGRVYGCRTLCEEVIPRTAACEWRGLLVVVETVLEETMLLTFGAVEKAREALHCCC